MRPGLAVTGRGATEAGGLPFQFNGLEGGQVFGPGGAL